jgi:hypothetical protein
VLGQGRLNSGELAKQLSPLLQMKLGCKDGSRQRKRDPTTMLIKACEVIEACCPP